MVFGRSKPGNKDSAVKSVSGPIGGELSLLRGLAGGGSRPAVYGVGKITNRGGGASGRHQNSRYVGERAQLLLKGIVIGWRKLFKPWEIRENRSQNYFMVS